MSAVRRRLRFKALLVAVLLHLTVAGPAVAYVDPGTTGLLTQLLYVLFYGALGVFFFCFRYLKELAANGRTFLAKLFTRRTNSGGTAQGD